MMLSDDRLEEAIVYWIDNNNILKNQYYVTAYSTPDEYYGGASPNNDSIDIKVNFDFDEVFDYLMKEKDYYSIDDMDDSMEFTHPYYKEVFDEFNYKFEEFVEHYADINPDINEIFNGVSHEGQYTDVEEISNEEDDFEEER